MRISLVVPVYNEAESIAACLDRVVEQQRPFDEVIVVDNNSTDDTVDIVRGYADRLPIRLVEESRQGAGPARERGFDEASGEVIGRIDADTRLEPDWCRNVEAFLRTHPQATLVGGPMTIYDVPDEQERLEKTRARAAAHPEGRRLTRRVLPLGGANMAIRASAWPGVKPLLKDAPGLHEDVDIFYAVRESGGELWELPTMIVGITIRRELGYTFASASRYANATLRTHYAHRGYGAVAQLALMLPLFHVFWISAKVKYGSWDPVTKTYREGSRRARSAPRAEPM